jgi:hypothetical protein
MTTQVPNATFAQCPPHGVPVYGQGSPEVTARMSTAGTLRGDGPDSGGDGAWLTIRFSVSRRRPNGAA